MKKNDRPFPFELVILVASFSTPGTVASLCLVSKDLNPVLTPALYRHLVITRANVDMLFLGLPRRAELHIGRKGGTRQAFKAEAQALRDKFPDLFEAYEAEVQAAGAVTSGDHGATDDAAGAATTAAEPPVVNPTDGVAAPEMGDAASDDSEATDDSDGSYEASDSDSDGDAVFEETDDDLVFGAATEAFLDAETDDELAPPFGAVQAATASCSWARRLALFRFTEHVTFAQVPGPAFASDLTHAVETLDPDLCPAGGARTYRRRLEQASARARRATWAHWAGYAGPAVFPRVVRVGFSSRVLQQRQLQRLRGALASPAFMRPRHACVTLPAFDVAAHLRRALGRPASRTTRAHVARAARAAGGAWRAARDNPAARIRALLPPTLETLAVHNVAHAGFTTPPPVWSQRRWGARKPCVPRCAAPGARVRLFYAPRAAEPDPDLADALVAARRGPPPDAADPDAPPPPPQFWEVIGPVPPSAAGRVRALLARPENAPAHARVRPPDTLARHLRALDDVYGPAEEIAFTPDADAHPCRVCARKQHADGTLAEIIEKAHAIP